ncbi:hypothetical protein CWB99_23825, partial [Pseudoalteromonas rubra]
CFGVFVILTEWSVGRSRIKYGVNCDRSTASQRNEREGDEKPKQRFAVRGSERKDARRGDTTWKYFTPNAKKPDSFESGFDVQEVRMSMRFMDECLS